MNFSDLLELLSIFLTCENDIAKEENRKPDHSIKNFQNFVALNWIITNPEISNEILESLE